MDPALLDSAVGHSPVGEEGRSGARLERLELADGSRVVVKRFDPATDLVMQATGDTRGREVELFRQGVLDGLPPSVRHPILDAWFDERGLGVLVMRDLGPATFSWQDVLTVPRAPRHWSRRGDVSPRRCSTGTWRW